MFSWNVSESDSFLRDFECNEFIWISVGGVGIIYDWPMVDTTSQVKFLDPWTGYDEYFPV